MSISRLKTTHTIYTTPEDGLNEIIIEFVPWTGMVFNITNIYTKYWSNDDVPRQCVRYHRLSTFTAQQQETIKRIMIEEWQRYQSFSMLPGNHFNENAKLRDHREV